MDADGCTLHAKHQATANLESTSRDGSHVECPKRLAIRLVQVHAGELGGRGQIRGIRCSVSNGPLVLRRHLVSWPEHRGLVRVDEVLRSNVRSVRGAASPLGPRPRDSDEEAAFPARAGGLPAMTAPNSQHPDRSTRPLSLVAPSPPPVSRSPVPVPVPVPVASEGPDPGCVAKLTCFSLFYNTTSRLPRG